MFSGITGTSGLATESAVISTSIMEQSAIFAKGKISRFLLSELGFESRGESWREKGPGIEVGEMRGGRE